MDINLLVRRLQHGESYTVINDTGDNYQVNNPPTNLSIKAAEVIQKLHMQLEQTNAAMLSLQRQLNELANQYELLQKTTVASEPKQQD